MTDIERDPDLEEEIVWNEPQWEPTQMEPLDIWSGLPDDMQYEVMRHRLRTYSGIDEEFFVSVTVAALAMFLIDAQPATRVFVNQLVALLHENISKSPRGLVNRLLTNFILRPVSNWPDAATLDYLLSQLGPDHPAAATLRKLAPEVERECNRPRFVMAADDELVDGICFTDNDQESREPVVVANIYRTPGGTKSFAF